MDTSKKYIEKCRKAVEIQDYWHSTPHIISEWARSYFVSAKDDSLIHYYDFNDYPEHSADYTWLPHQDQLQDMLWPNDGASLCILTRLPHEFIEPEYHCVCLDDDNGWACPECNPLGIERRSHIKSMEQLWLAFVQWELYGKKWDGKDWFEKIKYTLTPGLMGKQFSPAPRGERSEMKKSDSEFINHLNETSEMVAKWPAWKRDVLKMDKEYDFSKGKRFSVELALRLNKIVHDLCKDVPHDIGIKLAEEVTAFRMDSDRMDSTMYRIKTGDHYLKDF